MDRNVYHKKPGRPALPDDEKRSKQLTVRVRPSLEERVLAQAGRLKLSVSEVVTVALGRWLAEVEA